MNFACSSCALLGLVASLVGCGTSPPGMFNGHGGSAGITGGSAGAAAGSAGSSGAGTGGAGAGGVGGSSAGSAGDISGAGASAGVAGAAASGGQSGAAGSAGGTVGGGAGSAGSGGGAGSAGTAGGAGSAGIAGASGSAGNAGATLGQACVNDAECGGAPLICLAQTSAGWGSGAPPQGLCTLPCSQNGTCTAVAPGAACYKPGASGYCLESCVIGSAGAANKCHSRAEFACAEFSTGTATVDLCMPSCNGDPDCGGGTFCDPSSGMCVKTPKTGDPEGTPCDPAGVNTCKGLCLSISATAAVCADGCTTGAACRYDAANVAHGACLGQYALTDPLATSDLGDYGWCVETCACGADCDFSGDSCDAWQGTAAQVSALTQLYGNPGLCVPQPTTPLTVCQ